MELHSDFQDLIQLLIKHSVEFLLVGGYAVSVHSIPRFTEDINFLVRCSRKNSRALYQAIEKFGMLAPSGMTEDTFSKPGEFIVLGQKPFRIDILSQIDAVSFDEAALDGPVLKLSELQIPVINIDALIKNKRASGRPKDLLDLTNLEKAKQANSE